jgi:hypothetical protein
MRCQAARPIRERGPEKRAGRKASTALRVDLTTADLGKISDATLAGPGRRALTARHRHSRSLGLSQVRLSGGGGPFIAWPMSTHAGSVTTS